VHEGGRGRRSSEIMVYFLEFWFIGHRIVHTHKYCTSNITFMYEGVSQEHLAARACCCCRSELLGVRLQAVVVDLDLDTILCGRVVRHLGCWVRGR